MVKGVSGRSEKLGIKPGYSIKSINGQPAPNDHAIVRSMIVDALANSDFSHPALVEFCTALRPTTHYWMNAIRVGKYTEDEELMREIVFKTRLGVTLTGNRVTHVQKGQQAAKEGVKEGWRVHMVNGKLVCHRKQLAHTHTHTHTHTHKLTNTQLRMHA
mmetsp:Transcript_15901/g.25454  ORF Transcript_15901/g.25454 Transcript_15901/m.25454 type:complete len:159 (-) Transcript_15901:200-676(-)